eukprot:6150110-Karenia_brevis.AAC.1
MTDCQRQWFPFQRADANKLWVCFQCGSIVPAKESPFCISKKAGPLPTDAIIIQAVAVHNLEGVINHA